MRARIDEVNGDSILFVAHRTSRGATIAVQTDEAKAHYYDLEPADVDALVADLTGVRGVAALRPATGCEHPECYVGPDDWEGCTFVDPERNNDERQNAER